MSKPINDGGPAFPAGFQPEDKMICGGIRCPKCDQPEVPMDTPRTVYACGSSDYDQRPDTFRQSTTCYLAETNSDNLWDGEKDMKTEKTTSDSPLATCTATDCSGEETETRSWWCPEHGTFDLQSPCPCMLAWIEG